MSQIDSVGANGGAFLGVMNFDGAGNVSAGGILKPRSTNNQEAQVIPTTMTGTYAGNPDGTVKATVAFDVGFGTTLTIVPTDGGQGLQVLDTGCSPCGANVTFQGQAPAASGGLPVTSFFPNATGNIPISLTSATATGGGVTVYTAANATGNGTAICDGSPGTWTAVVPNVTIAVNPDVAGSVTRGAILSGNYFASIIGSICGQPDFETMSGLVTGTVGPGGATTLVLHTTAGIGSGIARTAGGSPNGSYGFQLNFSPFPAGNIGVMNFDGAGNVTVSVTLIGGGVNTAHNLHLHRNLQHRSERHRHHQSEERRRSARGCGAGVCSHRQRLTDSVAAHG